MRNALFAGTVAAVALAGIGSEASAADIFNVDYYTVAGTYNGPGSGDPDFNTIGCCTPTYTDEVKGSLGALGLPVYNTASAAPTIHDTTADGEITWWSPTLDCNVEYTGSSTVTTPFSNYNFYAPNGAGSNDSNGFQAAVFTGTFDVTTPETVNFSFGADDDAFLAVDGTVIGQEGGIHGVSAAPASSAVLADGLHTVELFYVDRNVTGAGLYFDVTSSDITVTPPTPTSSVPETGTWIMMILGFGAIGGVTRSTYRKSEEKFTRKVRSFATA